MVTIVLIGELSADYRIVLPLACACGAATVVSRRLEHGSLYRPRSDFPVSVRPVTPAFPLRASRTVSWLLTGTDLLIALAEADLEPSFVIDEHGRLLGRLRPETAYPRLTAERLPQLLTAADLADRDIIRVSIHATAHEVGALGDRREAACLPAPVVDDEGVLLGEVAIDRVRG
jgi:hypothetical protein